MKALLNSMRMASLSIVYLKNFKHKPVVVQSGHELLTLHLSLKTGGENTCPKVSASFSMTILMCIMGRAVKFPHSPILL